MSIPWKLSLKYIQCVCILHVSFLFTLNRKHHRRETSGGANVATTHVILETSSQLFVRDCPLEIKETLIQLCGDVAVSFILLGFCNEPAFIVSLFNLFFFSVIWIFLLPFSLRFRKQEQLEKQCARKERQRFRRTELALLREADTMPRGLQSYLNKLGKLKEKYDAKVKFSRKPRKSMDNPAVYRMSLSAWL